ncbi:MAG: adenylate/guanylate cyclase domain-containing protein [Thermodesulfobacteriota bacterium]
MITFIALALLLPFRLYGYKKAEQQLNNSDSLSIPLYHLPWKAFLADFATWVGIGILVATVYLFYYHSFISTFMKIAIGGVFFGIFGGMLGFLDMEGRVITALEKADQQPEAPRKMLLTVSSKMAFFMATMIFFMAFIILLVVLLDIYYLVENHQIADSDIYGIVFKEILFVFTVMLTVSLIIIHKYSRNLKRVIAIQVDVLEEVTNGNYDTRVPLVSADEFGQIAFKTNDLIHGLRERDVCYMSFGKYVTPEIRDHILNGHIPVNGERTEGTLLFSDLRDFTRYVDTTEPEEVIQSMREYFTAMEKAIRKYHGIVLQYVGDEIEAVFGVPINLEDHPDLAVQAALEMRKKLVELNQERARNGKAPFKHGIGVHTGKLLAGNTGSLERLSYALIGGTVNLASRIAGLNKTFGSDILVSGATVERLHRKFSMTEEPEQMVKGYSKPITVYRVES